MQVGAFSEPISAAAPAASKTRWTAKDVGYAIADAVLIYPLLVAAAYCVVSAPFYYRSDMRTTQEAVDRNIIPAMVSKCDKTGKTGPDLAACVQAELPDHYVSMEGDNLLVSRIALLKCARRGADNTLTCS